MKHLEHQCSLLPGHLENHQRSATAVFFAWGQKAGNWLAYIAAALLIGGCATAPRNAVPKALAAAARIPGFNEARAAFRLGDTNAGLACASFFQGFDASGGADRRMAMLSLSGGGENGAYGAGLLCGWTKAGTRPEFDVVTGISTGAAIAPTAFLGPDYDSKLRSDYKENLPKSLARKRSLFTILKHRDALADSKPLQDLIATIVGDAEVTAIAREHRKGRRLLVMTVRNGVPSTWGKLLLLSTRPVRPECNKTYAIVFKRTERVGSF